MEIRYLGHACFEISKRRGQNGSATVVTDPFDPQMVGLPFKKGVSADLVLVSHDHDDHNYLPAVEGSPYVIRGPGEYEIKEIKVLGIDSYHDAKKGAERGKNTIYVFEMEGVSFCHLGDLGHSLEEEQVNQIGKVDVLLVPVGGFYTIDGKTAVEVATQLEPLIVIPMHYRLEGMSGAFARLSDASDFVREFGKPSRTESLLKVSSDLLPPELEIVVLERSL